MHACDRQTDGQTEFSSLDRVCIPCSAVKTSRNKQLYIHFLSPNHGSEKNTDAYIHIYTHIYKYTNIYVHTQIIYTTAYVEAIKLHDMADTVSLGKYKSTSNFCIRLAQSTVIIYTQTDRQDANKF